MAHGLQKYKPGVDRAVHLVSAALLWSTIGIFLFGRGFASLVSVDGWWLIIAAVGLGSLKSKLVLDRVARNGVERIRRFADNTCIGAVYSWKSWLLAMMMVGFGLAMRHTGLPPAVIGTVSAAIGWSLLVSSRFAWQTWLTWPGHR